MTTARQTQTNRENSKRSTGPRSTPGKARSSRNALRHGLRSELPVLPGEDAADWETHHSGIVGSLTPAGPLETEMATRVALCLWRLRRVATYEVGVTMAGLAEVEGSMRRTDTGRLGLPGEEEPATVRLARQREKLDKRRETLELWQSTLQLFRTLPDLADDARVSGDDVYGLLEDCAGELPDAADYHFDPDDAGFLIPLGVPADEVDRAYEWDGWTVGMLLQAVGEMASCCNCNPAKLLTRAQAGRAKVQEQARDDIARLEQEVRQLEREVREQEERARMRRMLPGERELDRVLRYEAHVSRQMLQALHTLERLQTVRAGQPVPPPVALDVTVSGEATPVSCEP